jgi:hypothetical protein
MRSPGREGNDPDMTETTTTQPLECAGLRAGDLMAAIGSQDGAATLSWEG